MTHPVEPPPNVWEFPADIRPDRYGMVGVGADLDPGTLLAAYRQGLFPMPTDRPGQVAWFSPDPRGVLGLDDLIVSRSLRQSCRKYRATINQSFPEVIERCSALPREGGWISDEIVAAYERLHTMGWAHSVEVWRGDELVGGLYGVQINGLFAGESMFHVARDASKVALVALVTALRETGALLLDVQWKTDHLATLGVREIDQATYLELVRAAVAKQTPSVGVWGASENSIVLCDDPY